METSEVAVGDQRVFDIVMEEESILLEDLVFIGYGTVRKQDLTGAVTALEERDMRRGVQSSPVEMMQGKVPGLNITRDGDPTQSPAIILRGPSSLRSGAAMEPFYVIDGVPGASIDAISPDDIVRIDVLRDASSTAIYGSRAANGVIMVTTRRPTSGEFYINYSGYSAFETVANDIEMMTAEQLRGYLALMNQVPDDDDGSSINWQDETMRSGLAQNHNISLGGAFGESRYSASLGYFTNRGIVKASGRERITGRLSIDHTTLNDRATLGFNISMSQTEDQRNYPNIFGEIYTYLPTMSIRDQNGFFNENLTFSMYHNPLGLIEQDIYENSHRNLISNVTLNLDLFEGLKYNASAAYQSTSSIYNVYHAIRSSVQPGAGGMAQRDYREDSFRQFENYLTYQNVFAGSHDLRILLGYSWQEDNRGAGFRTANSGFVSDELRWNNLLMGATPERLTMDYRYGGSRITYLRMISVFSRINYNYDNRYLFQATIRRDGSSAFGDENQWGLFPSVSAAWRISNEKFMQDQGIFSDLRLRAGYGVSGNSLGFDPMIAQLMYGITGTVFVGGEAITAIGVTRNANPNLKWEETSVLNLGLDFGFMDNRITGTVEVYDKETVDLIWNYPVRVPPYMHSSLLANVGVLSNKGIEFQLDALAVTTDQFNWRTSFNVAHNKNEVVSLSSEEFETPERGVYMAAIGGAGQSGDPTQLIKEGNPLGTFFTRKWAGRDAEGVSMFYDRDGEPQYTVEREDYYMVESAQPRAIFGWSNSFIYGNLDLSLFVRGVYGNKILNGTLAALNSPIIGNRKNLPVFTLDEPINDYNSFFYSDRYIEDGSYLRLDNATLGYTIDISSLGITRARVYIQGNNLFVITNYRGIDPEINMGGLTPGIDAARTSNNAFYPRTRSIMLGLNVNF
jgi:TonB-dependent starch-binding outer membrane protein SusC